MINPCVLILLQAFVATNLALKGSHFLSLYNFLICYRRKFYSGPKDEKDSWFTTMRLEDKGVFYKIPSSMKKDQFKEWSINRLVIVTGYWCRREHMESYVLSYAFRKQLRKFAFLLVVLYMDSFFFVYCVTQFLFIFLVGPIVDLHLLSARVLCLERNFWGKDFSCVTELISRFFFKRIGQFNYVCHVNRLCLEGGYIVFPLGLPTFLVMMK